jgi:hypothetical protein
MGSFNFNLTLAVYKFNQSFFYMIVNLTLFIHGRTKGVVHVYLIYFIYSLFKDVASSSDYMILCGRTIKQ